MANERRDDQRTQTNTISGRLTAVLCVATAIAYFFSNPKPQNYYDYTFRVAANMLRGSIAFTEKQPSWLNEFVPFEGYYYSVFPLGSVLSMVPFASLKALGVIKDMPGALIAALLAGISCFLLLRIALRYDVDDRKRILLTLSILFGTFIWTNLTFAGAWQLALGFALVGELAAIYFTVFDRRPLIAGIFFAVAFGNRTENLLTAPIFMYLLIRSKTVEPAAGQIAAEKRGDAGGFDWVRALAAFCTVPFLLGVSTLLYNYVRFHSLTDFGYARIPGVLQEPWYSHGIFSVKYMPGQAWEMLIKLWDVKPKFPYLVPDGFSSSILISSPFLLLALRVGAKDGALKLASWLSVAMLTLVLWMHGNSGGWQFGYRYATVLLPWIFILLFESATKRVTRIEWALCGVAFVANAYATWLFNWTEYLKQ